MKTIGLLLLAGAVLAGQLPAQVATTASGGDISAGAANEFVVGIEAAGDMSAASSLYAKGCTAGASATLHETYMRKLLKWGRPDIALYPARALQSANPPSGLALAVLAYNAAKRNDLAWALGDNLKAFELLKDDPSVLANLGQLAVWAEQNPTGRGLTPAIKQSAEKNRPELMSHKEFAAAYEKAQAAYQQRDKLRDEFDQKIAAAADEQTAAKKVADDADKKYRDMSDQIDRHERIGRNLGRELDGWSNNDTIEASIRRDQIRVQLRQELQTIDDLKKQQKRFFDDSQPLVEKLRKANAAADQLAAQKNAALAKFQATYLWMPPAVDGVVTPENLSASPLAATAASGPFSASAPAGMNTPAATASPDQAKKQLDLAKTYLDNKMSAQAAQILREVIEKYPDTPAQAQKLLADIKP